MLAFILVALLVWAALAIIGITVKITLMALVGVILFSITGIVLLMKTVL